MRLNEKFFSKLFTLNFVLQVVGAAGGLWGNQLIAAQDINGFAIWIVSNAALVWLQVRTRLFVLVALHFAYLFFCFQGISTWSKESPYTLPVWLVELSRFIAG